MSLSYRFNVSRWVRDWIWFYNYCAANNSVWFAASTATVNVWRRIRSPHFNGRRGK